MSGGHGADGEPFGAGDDPAGKDDGPSELPNLGVRIVQLLVAPGDLFDRLRARPAWLGALLAAVGLGLLSVWLLPVELFEDFFRSGLPPDAPADAAEAQVQMQVTFRWLNPVLGVVIGSLVTAGVLLFVFNPILGGSARFRQLFSATTHAMIIPALGGLLTVPLQRATGDFETMLAFHLLFPDLEPGFLLYLLQGMSLFGLWAAVVLGIGMGRIYDEISESTGVSTVVTLFVLLVTAGAGLRALGQSFA